MPLTAKAPESNFKPVPAGSHVAICFQVIDLGTQKTNFVSEKTGEEVWSHKVMLGWEVPDELSDSGDPMIIQREYTLSLSEKSNLYNDLVGWRGREFSAKELGGFDLKNVLGKACLIQVVTKAKKMGGETSVVQSIGQLPKGMQVKPQHHKNVLFDVDEGPNSPNFTALPEWLQKKIRQCREWNAAEVSPKDMPPIEEPEPTVDVPF